MGEALVAAALRVDGREKQGMQMRKEISSWMALGQWVLLFGLLGGFPPRRSLEPFPTSQGRWWMKPGF